MNFQVTGHLGYEVGGPATMISSLQCMHTPGQSIQEESFLTSRLVDYQELTVGPGENRFARITLEEPGPLEIDYSAHVSTTVKRLPQDELMKLDAGQLSPEVIPYLFPSRYCESDKLRDVSSQLFPLRNSAYLQVASVVDWISQNIAYVSGSTGEHSSATTVMDQGQGVCRDFAHLGIALCRALTIPARYTTVYACQLEPQDFHACFEVYIDGYWLIFDATGLAPLNGLVRIATGRDASDAAVASLFGNIRGTALSVACDSLDPDFFPVTREDLHSSGEALILC